MKTRIINYYLGLIIAFAITFVLYHLMLRLENSEEMLALFEQNKFGWLMVLMVALSAFMLNFAYYGIIWMTNVWDMTHSIRKKTRQLSFFVSVFGFAFFMCLPGIGRVGFAWFITTLVEFAALAGVLIFIVAFICESLRTILLFPAITKVFSKHKEFDFDCLKKKWEGKEVFWFPMSERMDTDEQFKNNINDREKNLEEAMSKRNTLLLMNNKEDFDIEGICVFKGLDPVNVWDLVEEYKLYKFTGICIARLKYKGYFTRDKIVWAVFEGENNVTIITRFSGMRIPKMYLTN